MAGYLTVTYAKAGYLPAQRQVNVPWQDYTWLPDVVLISQDSQVTTIDLTAATPIQVARGGVQTDADGSRQATLLVPQGTQASMTLPDGSTAPLTTLHVRATEYTVGPNGPQAMPAELPPTSGYTYAVELERRRGDGGRGHDPDLRPAAPVLCGELPELPGRWHRAGWLLRPHDGPVGSLRERPGHRRSGHDGRSGRPGCRRLRRAADASALAGLGITDGERGRLAQLYSPGESLWRVPITHFTSWDCNWPFGPPPGAIPPNQPAPLSDRPPDEPDKECGSAIGVQGQTLGEDVGDRRHALHVELHQRSESWDRRPTTVSTFLSPGRA